MFETTLRLLTATAFLAYGVTCVFSQQMKREFERFGVPRFRVLVGVTQILAALGLFAAPWVPLLGLIASAGLAVQMLAGSWVRFRIGDTLVQASQALVFFVISTILAVRFGMVL